MFTILNKRHRTVFLLLFGLSLVAGVSLSPDCNNGIWEVLADQESYFNCTDEGKVQWTLRLNENTKPISLAVCNKNCNTITSFEELYIARATGHKTTMIIKPANNTKLYENVQRVNGSLECSSGDDGDKIAGCGLNFVSLPENVSCTTSNTSWSVNVSCVISSVYSSRKIYTCSLIRTQTKNNTLQTVIMVTSPTSNKITKNEVKVSGFCQFNTTLPPEEGNYRFLVSVSPGGRTFTADDKQFAVDRPTSPVVSCGPQPFVLENTTVTCTCTTTSLGQPAGYLSWVTGNQTSQETAIKKEKQELASKELHYSQVLTLSDNGSTWLRCDIIWGTEEIRGENYTASVGSVLKDLESYKLAVTAGIVCLVVVIFTVGVVIAVIRKLKKSKANKTRMQANSRPAYIAETANQREEEKKNGEHGVNALNSGLQLDTDEEYAVLHKFRDFVADDADLKIYDHFAKPPLPVQQDNTAKWNVSCPASHSVTVDDGSYANDDALTYMT